jgi:hypothetical protein
MLSIPDDQLKEDCKRLIEEKLQWGDAAAWTNRDFDSLSDKIFEVTSVRLSQTTLKRIWGKVKYDSAPTVTTLNTLAQFLGFEQWRNFRLKQSLIYENEEVQKKTPKQNLQTSRLPDSHTLILPHSHTFPRIAVLALGCGILAIVSWNYFSSKSARIKAAPAPNYSFKSKKIVSKGLPNSVVFEYDASASATDSVYIQQSWDSRLRARVPRDQHLHSSIYYYPGFFQAKLQTGNQVVKEQDVFIETDGWLSLVEKNPVPVYFKKEDSRQNGKLGLPLSALAGQHIEMGPETPWVFYANIREFGDLVSDNFILETSLRNDYAGGSNICQKSEIRILTEGNMISIPLSAKGCISENNLFCLGHFIDGKKSDLSGFGVDFSKFVKLRIEVTKGKASFFIDDKMIYLIDSIKMSTKIKGIVFRFQGTGSVDWVKLYRGDQQLAYSEEF